MYFALQQNKRNSEAYLNFLDDIIVRGNRDYVKIFSRIVQQAQELAKTGDFYSVDSERFGIVSYLSKFDGIIMEMDSEHLRENDFQKLQGVLMQETTV